MTVKVQNSPTVSKLFTRKKQKTQSFNTKSEINKYNAFKKLNHAVNSRTKKCLLLYQLTKQLNK